MTKRILLIIAALLLLLLCGCVPNNTSQVVATTRPVYDFTTMLCENTDISVTLLVTENVSCLHDYSLQVNQMKMLERAELIVMNGAGLEDFLDDVIGDHIPLIDCSAGIALVCPEDHHDHNGHSHETDPHIWLDVEKAKTMVSNIAAGLCSTYPHHETTINANEVKLQAQLDALLTYGQEALSQLSCRELITFHDGFSYFASCFDLHIIKAIEEESGSEASAFELIELINLVNQHQLPAIFTEISGSTSAAQIISAETGATVFALDMGMSENGYFDAMYHNITTIKEALK